MIVFVLFMLTSYSEGYPLQYTRPYQVVLRHNYGPSMSDIRALEGEIWRATWSGDIRRAINLETELEADVLNSALNTVLHVKNPLEAQQQIQELGMVVRRDKRTMQTLSHLISTGVDTGLERSGRSYESIKNDGVPVDQRLTRKPREGQNNKGIYAEEMTNGILSNNKKSSRGLINSGSKEVQSSSTESAKTNSKLLTLESDSTTSINDIFEEGPIEENKLFNNNNNATGVKVKDTDQDRPKDEEEYVHKDIESNKLNTNTTVEIPPTEYTTMKEITEKDVEIIDENISMPPEEIEIFMQDVEKVSSETEMAKQVTEPTQETMTQTQENESETGNGVDMHNEENPEEGEPGGGALGGILTGLLGSLSNPQGGLDLTAVTGLLGTLSMENPDGTYDFSGLQNTVSSLFGGGEEGGSNVGLFLGGLLGSVLRGIAGDRGAKGVGEVTGNIFTGILPGLSAFPDNSAKPTATAKPALDSGGFFGGLLSSVLGGSSGGSQPPPKEGAVNQVMQVKFGLFRSLFSIITHILGSSSG